MEEFYAAVRYITIQGVEYPLIKYFSSDEECVKEFIRQCDNEQIFITEIRTNTDLKYLIKTEF